MIALDNYTQLLNIPSEALCILKYFIKKKKSYNLLGSSILLLLVMINLQIFNRKTKFKPNPSPSHIIDSKP